MSYPSTRYTEIPKSLRIEDDAVPETDLEVEDLMSKSFSSTVATNLVNLYNVKRLQGSSVLDAYMDILQDYIRICKETTPSPI